MRIATPMLVLSLLAATAASAADLGPLAAGKPAGVRAAQSDDITPIIYFGAIAVGIGIALAVTHDNQPGAPAGAGGGGSTTTTTGTSP